MAEVLNWRRRSIEPFEFTNGEGDEVRIDASGETFVSGDKKGCFDGFDPVNRCYYVGSGLSHYDASFVRISDEMMVGVMPEIACVPQTGIPHHKHQITKAPATEGTFSCNVCGVEGDGWVYHCTQCHWHAHPRCVGVIDEPAHNTAALQQWLQDKQQNANTVPTGKVGELLQWLEEQWLEADSSLHIQIIVLGGTGSSGLQLMSVECLGNHHPRNWVKCSPALSDVRQCAPIGLRMQMLMLTLSNAATYSTFPQVYVALQISPMKWTRNGRKAPRCAFLGTERAVRLLAAASTLWVDGTAINTVALSRCRCINTLITQHMHNVELSMVDL